MTANFHPKTWLLTLLLIGLLMPLLALANTSQINTSQINNIELVGIDFQRTQQGNARVLIDFTKTPQLPEVEKTAQGLRLKFTATNIHNKLINLYDTNDFATQVNQLEFFQIGAMAELIIQIDGEFNYLLNTKNNQLQIEITKRTQQPRYTGELISLSYHDLPLRSVLVELANFLGLNLIADDSIQGNITLHLEDVPSDQALAVLLISQGLASRQQGKILLIAPAKKLLELEEQQQRITQSTSSVSPLEDAFIKVNYADAKAIQFFILGDQKTRPLQASNQGLVLVPSPTTQHLPDPENTRRFLSDRGHLLVDERTNTLYVRDIAEQVNRVKEVVKTLDVPVTQVMIEARIVVARTGVSDELGVSWGIRHAATPAASAFQTNQNTSRGGLNDTNQLISSKGSSLSFNPATGANFGFISNNLLLDLELAALASENRSEIISQPKVITSNRHKAVIRSGEEIPYSSVDKDGERITNFRQAELRLEVTPQVVGDGRIFLTLQVNNDSKGKETINSGPTINTNAVETQVLVNNGETIVIGGIFTSQKLEGEVKVPLLGDLPLIGWLFRRTFSSQEKVELLVFITPRMINDSLAK